jgi:hypothetical protein
MHRENPNAVQRRIRRLIGDERLKFIGQNVFETGLPVASAGMGKTSG